MSSYIFTLNAIRIDLKLIPELHQIIIKQPSIGISQSTSSKLSLFFFVSGVIIFVSSMACCFIANFKNYRGIGIFHIHIISSLYHFSHPFNKHNRPETDVANSNAAVSGVLSSIVGRSYILLHSNIDE